MVCSGHATVGLPLPQTHLTARTVLEKFAAIQMLDVHLPTNDGREVVLTRYTQPEDELELLKLTLPEQPNPKITAAQATAHEEL